MPRCDHAKSHLIAAKVSKLRHCEICNDFFLRENMQTRDEIITEIRAAFSELKFYGVKPEYVNLHSLSDIKLTDLLISLREQVARRKKFLGKKL